MHIQKTPVFARAFKTAFPLTMPICVAFCAIGISYGFLMHSMGFCWFYPAAMSLFIYTGAMEFVTINLLLSAFNPLHAFLLALMVGARHMFYGLSMLDKFTGCGHFKKLYLIFGMCDESFSINCSAKLTADVDRPTFMIIVTALNHFYWVAGAIAGALLGSLINFNAEGIDFMLTALFTAIMLGQWEEHSEHRPALLGICLTFICLLVFGPDHFLLPAMGSILGALLLLQPLLSGRQRIKKTSIKTQA